MMIMPVMEIAFGPWLKIAPYRSFEDHDSYFSQPGALRQMSEERSGAIFTSGAHLAVSAFPVENTG
jgi:hypothetical protein